MANMVGTVGTIVNVALQIKEAVQKVRQNKEECRDIANCVALNNALLKRLRDGTDITKDEVMRNALEDVEKSFAEALKLVKKCQKKHIIFRFFGAGDMANDLSRVQGDIGRKMQQASLACSIQGTMIVTKIQDALEVAPRTLQTVTAEKEVISEQEVVMGFTRFSLSLLKAATKNFCTENIIGKGGFSEVYKGVLPNEQVVAIKKFDDLEGIMFRSEFDICAKLEHKNVVNLLGYCIKVKEILIKLDRGCGLAEERKTFLVLRYVPNGSLKEITEGTRHIDWNSCFQIIQGIAQGVHYLHEQRIIHSDLKPDNILFELDMNPVIIDFGLSKILDPGADEIMLRDLSGTAGYMPPEHYSGRLGTKSDVFAFGITLIQAIISVCTRSKTRRWYGREEWDMMLHEAGGLKGLLHPTVQVDESQLLEINRSVEVGLLCTQLKPEDRPNMADVVQILSGEKELTAPKRSRIELQYPRRGHTKREIIQWIGRSQNV